MKVRVVLESGDRRVFATAIDWPGWSRSAKSLDDALATLVEYGPRYKKSIGSAGAKLTLPKSADDLDVVATVRGDPTTDYGVPHLVMKPDHEPLGDAELASQIKLLEATWKAFDMAATKAKGRTLATGPRGGGRSVAKMVDHVREADGAYIGALGAKTPPASADRSAIESAFVDALHAKWRGELPEKGPRGGERWPARYAIRRSAWHALDHAWEIEDRSA